MSFKAIRENKILAKILKPNIIKDLCQDLHMLEKYLNIEGFLEKYLKIKSS